jgi:hypothetical protein
MKAGSDEDKEQLSEFSVYAQTFTSLHTVPPQQFNHHIHYGSTSIKTKQF